MSGQEISSASVPLLLSNNDCENTRQDNGPRNALIYHLQASFRPTFPQIVDEIKQLYIIAFPMIITGLLVYGKSWISTWFLGKLGKEALAGGSMAIGLANVTGYSVMAGLALGMEPISSQACGAKQWPLMGVTLQRTIALLVSACIPISLLWLKAEPILLFLGQDPGISSVASTYLAYSLPDLVILAIINPLRIYLRTQNITLPLMLSAAFALVLHGPINFIFVHYFSLGVRGVALSVAIADLNLLATLLLYLCFSGVCKESWSGLSLESFKEWKPILRLAIPSCISVCLEWWWYELMIFFSGLFENSHEAVSTMGILIQATSLVYIFPSSLGQAVSARVGNELGANSPRRAKTTSIVASTCAVLMSFLAMSLMTSMRFAWGEMFIKTDSSAILSLTAAALPIAGLCELGNFPQTTICGVLRGTARPSLGANINLGSFYGVGLPVALFMGFWMRRGLPGLLLGLLAAQTVCAIIMVVVLMRTDWELQATRARQLTGAGGERDEVRAAAVTTAEDKDLEAPTPVTMVN